MREQYQDIVRTLAFEIEGGRFPDGATFPKRNDLAERFGLTRSTIDRSVRILVDRGYLLSRRGAGTIVATGQKRLRVASLSNGRQTMPIAAAPSLAMTYLTYEELSRRSDRAQLKGYDGLIWNMPGTEGIEWCRELPESLPQMIINRHMDDLNYVSTDHRGAIYSLTEKRLEALPDALPLYLDRRGPSEVVTSMRREGFVDACRKAERFYEILEMPDDFEARVDCHKSIAERTGERPLFILSGTRSMTGAVCAWAREQGLVWRKDLHYSDFDNDYPEEVWGVRVTSFLQDYAGITELACEKLLDLMHGREERIQVLVPPAFVDGNT
ncbi:MAG: GntR family transcriptional regulator [Planctomycetota bacterium]|jgi:DNA-binding LacI/PurR family transcriptional regulator